MIHYRQQRIGGETGMKPRERRETGQSDLFKARLDQIIEMGHPRVRLAQRIDWGFLEDKFGAVYTDGPGSPPLPTRLMAGLAILKYSENLSDERLCEAWLENPYYQYFCGEEFFQHTLPFDRSSLTRWRQRMGEERLAALVQESLAVAVKARALKPSELTQVVVDTTVQPKNIAHPTDAKLLHRARERLVRLAQKQGVRLRQSYGRVGKRALIQQQRYTHAKQFKRANKCLRKLKTYLGRVMRDIRRKIEGNAALQKTFAQPLSLGWRVLTQKKRQKEPKVYALHAPEVECIGKGKAHKPYEFGVKVSFATTVAASKGGQFIVHAKALPGNPYDGHTLNTVLPGIEAITGATLSRVLADAGYKGHNAPKVHKFRVYTQGQKRGVTEAIKRQFRRRAGIEPVIGHTKNDHRMGRNFLAHREGDAINAVLAAAGCNFRRLLSFLGIVLRVIFGALAGAPMPQAP
jgi:transposase, IS5 family